MKSIILLILCLLLLPQFGKAQDFISQDMQYYFNYCMDAREQIAEKRCDDLLLCAQKMSSLNIYELDDSVFVSLQPDQEVSLDGHVIFTDLGLEVIAGAIINGNSTMYNLHSINRGTSLCLAHRVIPAKKTMRYQILNLIEDVDLLIFPEKTGFLTAAILDHLGNQIVDEIILTDTGWGLLKFYVSETNNPMTIVITNNEEEDICCSFAINGI